MSGKDEIYRDQLTTAGDFVFDDRVVRVFPDMINRSVPGYGLVVPMIGILARRYAQADSVLYDLGCSLGACSLAMQAAVNAPGVRIVAVDNAPDMVSRLQERLNNDQTEGKPPIESRLESITETPIENASVVVMNFTLQFIEPTGRPDLLRRIRHGMRPGGVLLISEKIRFDDPGEQELQTLWHHDFKRAQGYSDLEIARKRDALENVMKPESLELHRQGLADVGFSRVYRWYQGFNFISLAAFA